MTHFTHVYGLHQVVQLVNDQHRRTTNFPNFYCRLRGVGANKCINKSILFFKNTAEMYKHTKYALWQDMLGTTS